MFTHIGSCRIFELSRRFLTWYCKLKASGNYTAVAMHSQSKSFDKKSATKCKGAAVKRPEIENYINPFQTTEISHHDYGTPTQSHTPASASLQNTSFITENVLLSGSPQDESMHV